MARNPEPTGEGKGTAPAEPRAAQGPAAARSWRLAAPSAREEELARAKQVTRPVALLALIDRMESWTISEDLLSALIEAAEAGVQIDSVYEGTAPQVLQKVEAEEEQEEEARAAQPTSATSMPVYRLAEGSLIHFSRDNKPISPPVQHLYVSRISHENCFGCELQMDAMVTDAPPHFKRGDILVFSTERKVENGDFVFLKTRVRDEFVQVFFGPEDLMRLRFLHPSHPERTLRRFEIKAMCRLIGRYQDL